MKLPFLLGGAGGEMSDRAFLAANGVRIALQGHLAFQASIKAVYDTLKALRDGVSPADLSSSLVSGEMLGKVTHRGRFRPLDPRIPAITQRLGD